MEYGIKYKINKLSKIYNYFEGKTAINILSSMSENEKEIVLRDKSVIQTILKIEDTEVLRMIFEKSPAFFQEIMFSEEKMQDKLISPRKSIKSKEVIKNYNTKDYAFFKDDLGKLEDFLHTIKSPKVYEQLIENKFFQRIVALCGENQLNKSFFRGIDEIKLFNNIVNDDEIFKNTRLSRKRHIIEIFNKISDHILLPKDYQKILEDSKGFIRRKKWLSEKCEKVYIDKETLSTFSTEMIEELLKYKNVDKEFIKEFIKKDLAYFIKKPDYDFNTLFPHLLSEKNESFNEIDYNSFNTIIEECQNNEIIKTKFIDFVYGILCNSEGLTENEIRIIKEGLYKKMLSHSISKEDYQKLFSPLDFKKTIFYLKFGKTSSRMDHLHGITPKQLLYLNHKHINQILKSLNLENEDELSIIYGCAIKMYFTFGLERTLKILNGDYGNLDKIFYNNVGKLNVSNVSLVKEGSKYIPHISNEFINFLFEKQKDNHFMDMLSNKEEELRKNWSYLYNNFDSIKERCHNNLTLRKLNIIFQELSESKDLKDITPDNYKLRENEILNDICLGNKTGKPNEQIYKTVLDIYSQMKERTESSIPYVKGQAQNGYSYEMMKFNDPIAFVLGYRCDCCLRPDDVAHNHLLHATLCRNGRILLIYNQNNELAGFSPLKRNGEVLIANSIECSNKKKNTETIEAFQDAIKDIVSTSQRNKEEQTPINLVCIGTEAYARPTGQPFPTKIKTPTIYEKDDPIYGNTDSYHKELTILYKNPKLNLNNIRYGNPTCSYQDPRNKIFSLDFKKASNEEIEKALKVIDAIRYSSYNFDKLNDEEENSFIASNKYEIDSCIYNDDWYILITYDGNIQGEYLKYDERAVKEYEIALKELKEKFKKIKEKNSEQNKSKILKKKD